MGGRGTFSPAARQRIRQAETRVNKSIKSYKKLITEHENYIKNPKLKYKDWNTFDSDRRQREINHWKSEIKAFEGNIQKQKKRLREVVNENKNK